MAKAIGAVADVPASTLQDLVDAAAHFYLHARSRPGRVLPVRSGTAVVGFEIEDIWRRLRAVTLGPPWQMPNEPTDVGEVFAHMTQRWLFCPDDFDGRPGDVPPPTPFDQTSAQRFVMLGGRALLEDVDGEFQTYCAGHTKPAAGGSVIAMAGGAGGGTGIFSGLNESTIAYCGTLDARCGFIGNVLVRAMDREGAFRTDRLAPEFRSSGRVEDGARYVIFRGQASPTDPVVPRMNPDGTPAGLDVTQSLRGLDVDCWVRRFRDVRSSDTFGPLIGTITAHVAFDPQAPGGGLADPVPFATLDELHFHDFEGRRLGGFIADSSEGRVFKTLVGGRPAIRFVGVGEIRDGDGVFTGIRGQMTDSSVVLFEPHVSASVYVLRITGGR